MNKNILFAGALSLLSTSAAWADGDVAKNKVLLGKQNLELNFTDTTVYVPVLSNQAELKIQSDVDWITPTLENKRLKLVVKANPNSVDRNANVTVASANGKMTRTLPVSQVRESLAEFVPTDDKVSAASATATAGSGAANQGGEGIERTLDGNKNTLWHSPYNKGGFPFTLVYKFNGVDKIDYLRYVPRPAGETNGNFEEVDVYVKCEGDADFKKVYTGNWKGSSTPKDVIFTNGLNKPKEIKLVVKSGKNNFASCAEMEFYKKKANDPNTEIFADNLWTSLKEGTTQADIDALTNPYCKFVAQQLLNNKDTFLKGRVGTYTCRTSPQTLSALWNTPGKLYDQLQGVTGININKGIHGIAVEGLPEGVDLTLKVVAWFAKELDAEGKGGGPAEYAFPLKNGINTIEYNSEYDGLAYVAYYSDETPVDHTKYPDIKVHFINGSVNGYLSPDRTNEELDEVLKNAKNRCIDLVGSKVHSIWQTSGMLNHCKALDGTSKGYVQFMNLLDTLVDWEHQLLGLKKYKREPDNRTMAYVNYTYYMFQGYYGVSFMYDQEPRVLNCKGMMKNDGDGIWGLSHEWGHQHQMQPYFCWAGLSESSNNMNSCENVLRMGYHDDWHAGRIKNAWNDAYNRFVKNVNDTATSQWRMLAYEEIDSKFAWCKEAQDSIRAQYNRHYDKARKRWVIPSISKNPDEAISTHEVGVESNTAAFYMLHNYFSFVDRSIAPDFQMDLYESLRQTDLPNGSTIEKNPDGSAKTEADKYELLAGAQNDHVAGRYAAFKEKYPNSVWVKRNFVTPTSGRWDNSVPYIFNYIRKASLLCGYNLFDYFDELGFMRICVMNIGDYGNKPYIMVRDMKEEFKKDMDDLGLKKLSEDMLEKMVHSDLPVYETPNIPNEPVKK